MTTSRKINPEPVIRELVELEKSQREIMQIKQALQHKLFLTLAECALAVNHVTQSLSGGGVLDVTTMRSYVAEMIGDGFAEVDKELRMAIEERKSEINE